MEEDEFLERINRNLPAGIKFSGLRRMSVSAPRLSRDTAGFVYSLDLRSAEVRSVLDAFKESSVDGQKSRESRVLAAAEALGRALPGETVPVSVVPGEDKICFRVILADGKSPRLQDVLAEVLGLKSAVFFLVRASVIY